MTICLFIASGGICIELFILQLSLQKAEPCRAAASFLRQLLQVGGLVCTHLRNRLGQQAQARAVHAGHVGATRTDHVHAVLLA